MAHTPGDKYWNYWTDLLGDEVKWLAAHIVPHGIKGNDSASGKLVCVDAMMALLLRAYGARKCTGAMHVLSQHSADHREYV